MTPILNTRRLAENQNWAKKVRSARFFWPVLRGIALIVALCAFIASLSGFVYGGIWEVGALPFLVLATYALIAMTPKPETLPAVKCEAAEKPRHLRFPHWSLIAYCVILGLGINWACAFLWFSRRHPFFSAPVIGLTGVIFAMYAVVGILVARLTGNNWRVGLLVFVTAPCVVGSVVFRLHLFR